jgi:8-oxo-dGTP diphosphatase
VERRRRIEAYGLSRNELGEVLLAPHRWALPGDTVSHGEHPAATVTRAFAEHGLRAEVTGIRDVITDLDREPDSQIITHHDRLIFDVGVLGGQSDTAVWVGPELAAQLWLPGFTAKALGLPSPAGSEDDQVVVAQAPLATNVVPLRSPSRHQRFAAYALVTDPVGRVLLTQIAAGYPGAGRWHLPGGGTDFGETAADGLLRELIEETNQDGRITGLIAVSHRHQRDAVGPERVAIDWHGVRVVFRALVDRPTAPRVMEGNGSTQAAAWFGPGQALTLDLTEVARTAVADHDAQ